MLRLTGTGILLAAGVSDFAGSSAACHERASRGNDQQQRPYHRSDDPIALNHLNDNQAHKTTVKQ
jgi:hypothetical protein